MVGNFNMGTIQVLQFFFQSAILLSLAHLVMCSCVGRFGRFLYKHWKLFQNCSKVAACTTKQFVICPFKPLDSWGCTGKSGENKKIYFGKFEKLESKEGPGGFVRETDAEK